MAQLASDVSELMNNRGGFIMLFWVDWARGKVQARRLDATPTLQLGDRARCYIVRDALGIQPYQPLGTLLAAERTDSSYTFPESVREQGDQRGRVQIQGKLCWNLLGWESRYVDSFTRLHG